MVEELVRQYLKKIDFVKDTKLNYKLIKSVDAEELKFNKSFMPKISIKDALLKSSPQKNIGDVIAIYRDYELVVSPYYYYRVITE